MRDNGSDDRHDRWAKFRFAVVGRLLAAPPQRGELHAALVALSKKQWRHPLTDEPVHFGVSTIERWYLLARKSANPMEVLRRQVRSDAGQRPSMPSEVCAALRAQHRTHPRWSKELHRDNLVVVAEEQQLGPVPSVSTVRRWMNEHDLRRQPRRRQQGTEAAEQARRRFDEREVRSYEVEYVGGLWHLDFHDGSRKVLTRRSGWLTPQLLALLDDHSRLCCHAQWYLDETAETLTHSCHQGFQKRGLPRELMFDGGSAMKAAEFLNGLEDLSIADAKTLAYSPEQNAKCEVWWQAVEGRLMPMLEGVKELTLDLLNQATAPWVELDYNQGFHSEIGTTPLRRFLDDPDVSRECPSSLELRRVFRCDGWRRQRKSDGTITVLGRRFEVPSRLRHLSRLRLRFARWDLRTVDVVDPRNRRQVVATLYPLDKAQNAEGRRRRLAALDPGSGSAEPPRGPDPEPDGIAPLLRKLMADYSATGLPPAYLADHRGGRDDDKDEDAIDPDCNPDDGEKE